MAQPIDQPAELPAVPVALIVFEMKICTAEQCLAARDRQMRRNFEFFGAPTAVFVFVHRGLREYSILDSGVLLQTLMLAAQVRGLGTCAQGALAIWAGPVRAEFDVPDDYALICGLSIGYPSEHPVNDFRPVRAPLDEILLPVRGSTA